MNVPIQRKEIQPGGSPRTLRMWLLGVGGLTILIIGAFIVGSSGSSGTGNGSVPGHAIAPAATSAVTHQVSMRNLRFDPVTIEIKRGDVVEWKNEDMVVHTATSASFDSGTIASGQSRRHTFPNAGDFPYACTFHPQMKGTIIVK